jgi:hypothetical protein
MYGYNDALMVYGISSHFCLVLNRHMMCSRFDGERFLFANLDFVSAVLFGMIVRHEINRLRKSQNI